MGYGSPTSPARGGVAELDMHTWLANGMPEIARGTIVRNPQTGEAAQWNGSRWEPRE